MKATEVTAGLAESNGSLLPGLWPDSLHVTCGLTACTPGSAPGPTLGNEYGKTLPFYLLPFFQGGGQLTGYAPVCGRPCADGMHSACLCVCRRRLPVLDALPSR